MNKTVASVRILGVVLSAVECTEFPYPATKSAGCDELHRQVEVESSCRWMKETAHVHVNPTSMWE